MLNITLTHGGHWRSFEICPLPQDGWLAVETTDGEVDARQHLTDWHKVERVATRFQGEAAALQHEGWVEVDKNPRECVS